MKHKSNKFELMRKLDFLIRNNDTGSRAQLSRKLGISIPTLYRLIEEMKTELDAPIVYYNKQYHYAEEGSLRLGFSNQ